jgi:hypothetical protein
MLLQVLHLRAVLRQRDERHVGDLVVGHRDVEAIAELLQRIDRHLLRLVRDHLAFAGFTHPEALDRLRENDGRLVLVLHRRRIGRVHLERIVAAAVQLPYLVVGKVGDHRLQFGELKKCSRT